MASHSVLDASALLALLNNEPGTEVVAQALHRGVAMSAVNYSEVVGKLRESGIALDEVTEILQPLNIQIVAFTEAQAVRAGDLRPETKPSGLSLGDLACLALAEELRLPALTADREWRGVTIGVTIQVIR